MDEFKLIKQKFFESNAAYEKRLNEICNQGWKPISLASDNAGKHSILLQKVDKYVSY